jgi:hypothetical protein
MSEQKSENVTIEMLRARLEQDRRELAAIRERAAAEYRHEPGEQYTPMLRDIRFLLGQLNVATEFWESGEKELDEIRVCDKCDLCEDHHE